MENAQAMKELRALLDVGGALRIITSEHACGSPTPTTAAERKRCDAYECPRTHPAHFAIHDVVRLEGDRLLCVYNDSKSQRSPLSVAVSDNRGRDWIKIGDLEREPGEFSYPSLLNTADALYLAYTYKRQGIKFVALDKSRV